MGNAFGGAPAQVEQKRGSADRAAVNAESPLAEKEMEVFHAQSTGCWSHIELLQATYELMLAHSELQRIKADQAAQGPQVMEDNSQVFSSTHPICIPTTVCSSTVTNSNQCRYLWTAKGL